MQAQWGEEVDGLRFGLRPPAGEVEAGGTIVVELLCQNRSNQPVNVFGFETAYPRSLRVSPPKAHRPWIRVSFGDVNVLHPPEAFTRLLPGATVSTGLDLSFAFDRRGAGGWRLAFAYDPVRAGARMVSWTSDREVQTGIAALSVTTAKSLREAGIDAAAEARLDSGLLTASPSLIDDLRQFGFGGAVFAARRVARVLSSGAESTVGWRALDALGLLGDEGVKAIVQTRQQLPHAEPALAFAEEWIRHQAGDEPAAKDLPFLTMLERVIEQPDQRGNFLLTWTSVDSEIHGTRRLQVFGNGERVVTGRLPGATVASTRRSSLSPMQVKALAQALRFGAVWLLRPLRAGGLPDEPRPTLEVQLALGEPFSRYVAMWNGEWRLGPAAQLADLLDRLGRDASPDSMLPPAS